MKFKEVFGEAFSKKLQKTPPFWKKAAPKNFCSSSWGRFTAVPVMHDCWHVAAMTAFCRGHVQCMRPVRHFQHLVLTKKSGAG
ncbi:hypothetical protein K6L44_12420 [Gluconacetobacter entanii]|uniref:hypothetical protein n=1 Tax=Gluconacetobacter entanii TaxID=108528 RepID=UPI00142DE93C|nr:hypothetical protein [Gluconacetobacter entanii]MCE2579006.1 hypothetical protein [Komagataeibacter sp. FNDCR1]MBY4640773.1 hypothetical protein [Gluconacetobacter entanii]MCW4581201.1 hypothetical protein [Gluconacetobacter entanii]MCW4584461.1 hypothetical protein [Gluconacetobacter entanii]MCW4587875.1 hypothetical protein [Gluconacetobacter entanii]